LPTLLDLSKVGWRFIVEVLLLIAFSHTVHTTPWQSLGCVKLELYSLQPWPRNSYWKLHWLDYELNMPTLTAICVSTWKRHSDETKSSMLLPLSSARSLIAAIKEISQLLQQWGKSRNSILTMTMTVTKSLYKPPALELFPWQQKYETWICYGLIVIKQTERSRVWRHWQQLVKRRSTVLQVKSVS